MFRRPRKGRAMGRLEAGGLMTVPSRRKAIHTPWAPAAYTPCDGCGYSHDGVPLGWARFTIKTRKGPIDICGHHFWTHWLHIHERGYHVKDL